MDQGHDPQVSFSMAFSHRNPSMSSTSNEPIWFTVDSTLREPPLLVAERESSSLHSALSLSTLKRQIDTTSNQVNKKPKECHDDIGRKTKSVSHFADRSTSTLNNDSHSKPGVCEFLQECSRGPSGSSTTPYRTLEDSKSCLHLVCLSPAISSRSCQPMSLQQLISPADRPHYMTTFPPYERLRLARTLATAVLQYHSTPWLQGQWRSEDVYFFGLDEEGDHSKELTFPHVYARINRSSDQVTQVSSFRQPQTAARNPLLFSLGVVLLEITHTLPIQNLRRTMEFEHRDRLTDFLFVRNLAKSGCTGMGIRYDKIVQRLVECDFGCGDDLHSPELQSAFHDTIISPLDRLEQKLREFHFDS